MDSGSEISAKLMLQQSAAMLADRDQEIVALKARLKSVLQLMLAERTARLNLQTDLLQLFMALTKLPSSDRQAIGMMRDFADTRIHMEPPN